MDYKTTATKNVLWATIGQGVTRLFGFLLFFYMAFRLGDVTIGVFSFLFAFLGIGFTLGELGIFQYLTRKWARDNSNWQKDFSLALQLKLLTSAGILLFLLVYLMFYDQHLWVELILAFVALVLDQIRGLQETYFTAHNQFRIASTALIIERCVEAIVGLTALLLGFGLQAILIIYIAGRVAAILYQRRKQRFVYFTRFAWKPAGELVRGGLPFLFIGAFTLIYFRIDTVMLKYMEGFDVVGWYNAAYRFIDLLGLIPGIFITSTFPLFTKLFHDGNRSEYANLFQKTFKYLFILGTAAFGIGSMVAHDIIGSFYTDNFQPAGLALQILLLASFLIFMDYIFFNLMAVQNQEKKIIAITGCSAAINVGLNLILIPRYSLYGAAVATVITEVFNLVAAGHYLTVKPNYREMGKIILASVPALVFLWTFREWNWIVRATAGIVLYALSLVALNVITRAEIIFYTNILRRRVAAPLPETDRI